VNKLKCVLELILVIDGLNKLLKIV